MKHRTVEGQTADLIAWKHYGNLPGCVEILLEANPGLASYGPILPSGIVIELPTIAPGITTEKIRLWD